MSVVSAQTNGRKKRATDQTSVTVVITDQVIEDYTDVEVAEVHNAKSLCI